MMPLLAAAEPREFGGVLARARSVRPASLQVNWVRFVSFGAGELLLVANGAGRARAAAAVAAACDAFPVTSVVSTGFCGALVPEIGLSEVVVASAVITGQERYEVDFRPGEARLRDCVVYSSARIAGCAAEKRGLRDLGAHVVEMEAAGVAEQAHRRGLPFACVRVVTDLADEDMRNDFNAALRPDGQFDTIRLLRGTLRDPWRRVRELVRLRNRCACAAIALGDFVGNCRF
jgi:adenosylhomocysteine nucleosidase